MQPWMSTRSVLHESEGHALVGLTNAVRVRVRVREIFIMWFFDRPKTCYSWATYPLTILTDVPRI